jgi:hypothetical protein
VSVRTSGDQFYSLVSLCMENAPLSKGQLLEAVVPDGDGQRHVPDGR